MAEAGYPGQTAETPIGIFVPAGTPKEIVDLLHRKVVALIATPDVKQKLAAIGFAPIGDTPAEFAAFLKAEDEKWGKVIRDAGIKMRVAAAHAGSRSPARSSRGSTSARKYGSSSA